MFIGVSLFTSKQVTIAAGWSEQEMRVLVSIRGKADVQSQLDGVVGNKVVYKKVAIASYASTG